MNPVSPDQFNEDWQSIRPHVEAIAVILRIRYPAVELENHDAIPLWGCEPIAHHLTMVIAEVIQAWIDAGSERDVTLEELFDPIYQHLVGWSDQPEGEPA